MVTLPQVNRSSFNAIRIEKNKMRLTFEIQSPQSVIMRLVCSEHPWIWEENIGLRMPGQAAAEITLEDWPEDTTYLLVRFYEEDGRPASAASQCLPFPRFTKP